MKIKPFLKKNTVKNFGLFLYIFMLIFGPLIGLFDLSIIFSLLGILVSLAVKTSFKIKINPQMILIYTIILLTLITTISFLYNNTFNIVLLIRPLRVGLNILSTSMVISTFSVNSKFIIRAVIYSILIHAIIVLISANNADLQVSLSHITGYNKMPVVYRSSGLTPGFDISGLIICLGFFLSVIDRVLYHRNNIIIQIVLSIAVLFTSRFSIILYGSVLLISLYFFKKNKCGLEYYLFSFVTMVIFIIGLSLASMSIATSNLNLNYSNRFFNIKWINDIVISLRSAYAFSDVNKIAGNHFDLSELNNWLIGDGYYPSVDPGYTVSIYSTGFIGLVFSLSFYVYILIFSIKKYKSSKDLNSQMVSIYLIFWALCILIFNFKNDYFFSSYTNEMGVIILSVLMYSEDLIKEFNLSRNNYE